MQVCKYSESFRVFITVRKPLDHILSCTNPYHIHRICQHVISICIQSSSIHGSLTTKIHASYISSKCASAPPVPYSFI